MCLLEVPGMSHPGPADNRQAFQGPLDRIYYYVIRYKQA